MNEPLLNRVRNRLADNSGHRADSLARLVREESRLLVDRVALAEITGDLAAELSGAGPLEPLLATAGATDILVNGPDQVFLDRGAGIERTEVRFPSAAAIRALAVRLAGQAGRRLDDSAPFVDVQLPDGTRMHAILPPLVHHPTISLRVLTRRRFALGDLVTAGLMDEATARLLEAILRSRLTILISGGTGTGKTTLLSALLATVPSTERIVTIEDAAELAVDHPHVVATLARSANVEGAGAVSMSDLVRQALRMRADRIVVGEFRGAEMVDLLGALNTGHAGSAATVHANSTADVPARLVALAALAGMPAETLLAQAASAIDVLVHIRRDPSGRRRLDELALWPRRGARHDPVTIWTDGAGLTPAVTSLVPRLDHDGALMLAALIPGSR